MTTRLDYIPGSTIVPDNSFTISPSSLGKFFDEPHTWYREHVLGQRNFGMTTATILGTIVHFCGEEFIKTKSVDKYEIYRYLYKITYTGTQSLPATEAEALAFVSKIIHPEIDVQHILEQYRPMGNALIAYLKTRPTTGLVSEKMVSTEIIPGYYLAGSCDLVAGKHLYDFKTTSALSAPSSITYGYRLQLLAYSYAFIKSDIPIDTASIIWITTNQTGRYGKNGKPLADYPATCTLSSAITLDEQALLFIESILRLVAETVQFVTEFPDKAYIAFRDYRLKLSEIPQIPFTRRP